MSEYFNKDEDSVLDQPVVEESAPEAPVEEPKVEEAPVVEEAVVEATPVVEIAEEPAVEKQGIGIVNGAIGVAKTTSKPAKKTSAKKAPEVAYVWSDRSLYWNGVGNLSKGFNVISKSVEDKWLSKSGVRKATQEEINKEHGR